MDIIFTTTEPDCYLNYVNGITALGGSYSVLTSGHYQRALVSETAISDGFFGSVRSESLSNRTAVVAHSNTSSRAVGYVGFYSGSTNVFLPYLRQVNYAHWFNELVIQNLGTSTASVRVHIYLDDSTYITHHDRTIAPGQQTVIDRNTLPGLFEGSVWIESKDYGGYPAQPVAAVVLQSIGDRLGIDKDWAYSSK